LTLGVPAPGIPRPIRRRPRSRHCFASTSSSRLRSSGGPLKGTVTGCGIQNPIGFNFLEQCLNRLPGIEAASIEKYCQVVLRWGPYRANSLRPFNDCFRALCNHMPILSRRQSSSSLSSSRNSTFTSRSPIAIRMPVTHDRSRPSLNSSRLVNGRAYAQSARTSLGRCHVVVPRCPSEERERRPLLRQPLVSRVSRHNFSRRVEST
jgi:hypothetical protein